MFALLANFKRENTKAVLSKIVKKVHDSSKSDFAQNRHMKHLRILAQLRNFELIISEIMKPIETYFKIERDPYYIKGEATGESRGLERGMQEKRDQVIKNMITKLGLNDEQIVAATEATLNHVKKMRTSLNIQ